MPIPKVMGTRLWGFSKLDSTPGGGFPAGSSCNRDGGRLSMSSISTSGEAMMLVCGRSWCKERRAEANADVEAFQKGTEEVSSVRK